MPSSSTAARMLVTQEGAVTMLFTAALREEALLGVKPIGLSLPRASEGHVTLHGPHLPKNKKITRNKTDSPQLLSIWIQVPKANYIPGPSSYVN